MNNAINIIRSNDGRAEAQLKQDTIWLTQRQLTRPQRNFDGQAYE